MDEATLGRVWRAQRFERSNLRTTTGATIEIIYPGRPQRGPGPDFRGAILTIDREVAHGDIELHIRSADWTAHHHERDRAYNCVVLHVILTADSRPTLTRDGRSVPTLALAGRISEGDLAAAAEPVLPPCRPRVDALTDRVLATRLDALGDARLSARADAIESDLSAFDPETVLYGRILEALGYSRNRAQFRALAEALPVEALQAAARGRSELERGPICEAIMLGASGLLPSQRPELGALDWDSTEYAEEMERVWLYERGAWCLQSMDPIVWSFSVRPANSPPRRVAAAARLVAALLGSGLTESVRSALVSPARQETLLHGREAFAALAAVLSVGSAESYWASHFDFGRALHKGEDRGARLVGTERARETAVSVALPFALALARWNADSALAAGVWRAYHAAPKLTANEITRTMTGEIIGEARARLLDGARRQQGLHHLYRQGCEGVDCDRCPLFDPRFERLPASA